MSSIAIVSMAWLATAANLITLSPVQNGDELETDKEAVKREESVISITKDFVTRTEEMLDVKEMDASFTIQWKTIFPEKEMVQMGQMKDIISMEDPAQAKDMKKVDIIF